MGLSDNLIDPCIGHMRIFKCKYHITQNVGMSIGFAAAFGLFQRLHIFNNTAIYMKITIHVVLQLLKKRLVDTGYRMLRC